MRGLARMRHMPCRSAMPGEPGHYPHAHDIITVMNDMPSAAGRSLALTTHGAHVAGSPRGVLREKFDHSVSLLAWGLNEAELLKPFLDRAFALLESTVTDYEVVFVDDGSTDR